MNIMSYAILVFLCLSVTTCLSSPLKAQINTKHLLSLSPSKNHFTNTSVQNSTSLKSATTSIQGKNSSQNGTLHVEPHKISRNLTTTKSRKYLGNPLRNVNDTKLPNGNFNTTEILTNSEGTFDTPSRNTTFSNTKFSMNTSFPDTEHMMNDTKKPEITEILNVTAAQSTDVETSSPLAYNGTTNQTSFFEEEPENKLTFNGTNMQFSTNSSNESLPVISDSSVIPGRNDSVNKTVHSNSTNEAVTKEPYDVVETTLQNKTQIGTVPVNLSSNHSKEDSEEGSLMGFNTTNETESEELISYQSTPSMEFQPQNSSLKESLTIYSSSSSVQTSTHKELFVRKVSPVSDGGSIQKTHMKQIRSG